MSNKVDFSLTNISNLPVQNSSNVAYATIAKGGVNISPVYGNFYTGVNTGPANGFGALANVLSPNPEPVVTDTANLGFQLQYRIVPGRYWNVNKICLSHLLLIQKMIRLLLILKGSFIH